MKYTIRDAIQVTLAVLVSIIVFFAIRSGNPIKLEPMAGFLMFTIWNIALYYSFKHRYKNIHFFIDLILVVLLNSLLAMAFKLTTLEELRTNFFGTSVVVGTIISMPIALLFDKLNVHNILRRFYVYRGR